MKLGIKGRYAIMGMVDLACHDKDCPLQILAIAKRQESSLYYLEQLFANLRRGGLVSSALSLSCMRYRENDVHLAAQ